MQELQSFVGHEGRIMRAVWGPLNQTLISAGEDGSLRLWDVEVRGKYLLNPRRRHLHGIVIKHFIFFLDSV